MTNYKKICIGLVIIALCGGSISKSTQVERKGDRALKAEGPLTLQERFRAFRGDVAKLRRLGKKLIMNNSFGEIDLEPLWGVLSQYRYHKVENFRPYLSNQYDKLKTDIGPDELLVAFMNAIELAASEVALESKVGRLFNVLKDVSENTILRAQIASGRIGVTRFKWVNINKLMNKIESLTPEQLSEYLKETYPDVKHPTIGALTNELRKRLRSTQGKGRRLQPKVHGKIKFQDPGMIIIPSKRKR